MIPPEDRWETDGSALARSVVVWCGKALTPGRVAGGCYNGGMELSAEFRRLSEVLDVLESCRGMTLEDFGRFAEALVVDEPAVAAALLTELWALNEAER